MGNFTDKLPAQKGKLLQAHVRQMVRLESLHARLLEVDRRFTWVRLFVFLFGGLLVFLSFSFAESLVGVMTALVYAGVFLTVVLLHRKHDARVGRARISMRLIKAQIARMKLDWAEIPLRMQVSPSASHPFDSDLNISGNRSLHHLLDTAISLGGSQRLREWLLEKKPDKDVIEKRQSLLKEVIKLAGFRQRLSLLGEQMSGAPGDRWDGEALIRWLETHKGEKNLLLSLLLLFGLALLNLTLFILNAAGVMPPFWILSLLLYASVYIYRYRLLSGLFQEAYHLSETLAKFRAVLLYLEKYPYPQKGRLADLCRLFWESSPPPSGLLRRLSMVASAASLQGNPIIWILLNILLPWDLFFAHLMERYKGRARQLLPGWLDAWYELEAVNSLANFAYLNPELVFPTIVDQEMIGEMPVFSARKLGHPLISDPLRITNDFEFNHLGELVIVTGSNMSGKSTFLRTLGINLVLAYSGGPVAAAHLETLPFRLYSSMNLSDSLSDGISYFYAEVKRLKGLLDEIDAGVSQPVFFLIDEIFRGTNNRERRIGSRAYIQRLAGAPAVGAVATHDLELARLGDELPLVFNFHFREDVLNGKMVFDYRLRPGPCPTTNALKIMQIEGLPVSQDR
jgi:hypothetical protein